MKGFTLTELLLCLMLCGMLCFFSIPTEFHFYEKNRQRVIRTALESAIRHARMDAMRSGTGRVLAPLSDNQDWSHGIGLYTLKNFKQTPRPKPTLQWTWPTLRATLTWRGFQSQKYLYFMPNIAHNAVNGVFSMRVGSQPEEKLVVNRLGYMKKMADDLGS